MKSLFSNPLVVMRLLLALLYLLLVVASIKVQNHWLQIALGLGLLIYIVIYMVRKTHTPISTNIDTDQSNQATSTESIKPTTLHDVKLSSVVGLDVIKEEIEDILDYLKNPKKYKDFGITMPRGLLLVGPPGVGKTMLAKAISSEAKVPFFYQSGSSFVEMYVGVGAKRVRELFNAAKLQAPSIIFIDEIDSIGKKRELSNSSERESTLNQLLVEMNGFDSSSGVVVIGATNRIDVLDEALLRAGRFDRRVFISLPSLEDRAKIIQNYLKTKPNTIDVAELAKNTVGFSGAEIETLINEAAIKAIKNAQTIISQHDIEAVKSKVKFGQKSILGLKESDKSYFYYYHAVCAVYLFEHSDYTSYKLFDDYTLLDTNKEYSSHELLSQIAYLLIGNFYLRQRFDVGYSFGIASLQKGEAKLAEQGGLFGISKGQIEQHMSIFIEQNSSTIERYKSHLSDNETINKGDI